MTESVENANAGIGRRQRLPSPEYLKKTGSRSSRSMRNGGGITTVRLAQQRRSKLPAGLTSTGTPQESRITEIQDTDLKHRRALGAVVGSHDAGCHRRAQWRLGRFAVQEIARR